MGTPRMTEPISPEACLHFGARYAELQNIRRLMEEVRVMPKETAEDLAAVSIKQADIECRLRKAEAAGGRSKV